MSRTKNPPEAIPMSDVRTMRATGGDIAKVSSRVPGILIVSTVGPAEDGTSLAAYHDSTTQLVVRWRDRRGWFRPVPAHFELQIQRGAENSRESYSDLAGATEALRRHLP